MLTFGEVIRGLVAAIIFVIAMFSAVGLSSQAEKFTNPREWKISSGRLDQVQRVVLSPEQMAAICARYQTNEQSAGQIATPNGAESRVGLALSGLKGSPIDLANRPANKSNIMRSAVKLFGRNGTPVFMTGPELRAEAGLGLAASSSCEQRTIAFITEYRTLFKLSDPSTELTLSDTRHDDLGYTHVSFDQVYEGVPYWGRNLVAHFNSDGDLIALNARYAPSPMNVDVTAGKIASREAVRIAIEDLATRVEFESLNAGNSFLPGYSVPQVELYIWSNRVYRTPRLVWHVDVRPNLLDWWYYFIDAESGEILEARSNVKTDGPTTGSGVDLLGTTRTLNVYQSSGSYYMVDASRPIWQVGQPDPVGDPKGGLVTYDIQGSSFQWSTWHDVVSADNTWPDNIAVSAHYNLGVVFSYFYNTHGRLAIDGNGGTMMTVIHVGDESGQPYDNAFWNGVAIWFGDGRTYFKPLAGALDITAHEVTHGVVDYTISLDGTFQPGALNESMADVGGVLVDAEDWKIGEDIVEPAYYPTGCMRDLEDPHNGGSGPSDPNWLPAHMDEYQDLPLSQDNGGVHINCGITNRAAFLIGDAIGKEKLGAIYYRIMDARYLSKYAEFIDMRLAAVQSATDLYGEPSAEVDAVEAAFDAVGIGSGPGSDPPPDDPPVDGTEWIAVVNAEGFPFPDESLYLVSSDSPPSTIDLLSTTQINSETGKPLDVRKDGSVIMFVDENNWIRSVNIDTDEETVFDNSGIWSSIALSADGTKLAATTIYIDSVVYIFDLVVPENSKIIKLYSPTTQDSVRAYTTEFADVMDWDVSGEYLVFDAFNSIEKEGGSVLEYWEVNILNVEDEIITRLFAPNPEGVSAGNPSFAETNDLFLVFDYMNVNSCTNEITAVNLFTGEAGIIRDNGCTGSFPNLGFPKYSPDDGWIVFQWEFLGTKYLRQIPIDETKISPAGPFNEWVSEGQLPNWFARGEFNDADDPGEMGILPVTFTLRQNYPNPFNAATTISYDLHSSGNVRLTIYNLLGQEVTELVDEYQSIGEYVMPWDGRDSRGEAVSSGVYFYSLKSDQHSESKKMVLLK